jgi:nicotinamidase-related amidase
MTTVERPPLAIEPARTALVLLDLLRGIVASPCAPHRAADVVTRADSVATALRAAGGLVVPVRVLVGADGLPAAPPEADFVPPAPASLPPDWMELAPEFGAEDGDLVIAKPRWSAFTGTELDRELRRRGITTIILGGIATNLGVDSTARSAFERGYEQIIVEDMTTAFDPRAHELNMTGVFPLFSRVRPHDEVIAAIKA